MTSTLTLYYECLVEQDRNFLLDNNGAKGIELYLQTLSNTTISNYQYVKQALNLTIKVDMSQTGLNMGSGAQDLNYVKIQNGNDNPCYYFVISKTWKAQNTIELVLEMDTLNSYQYDVDYVVDKKTFIKRQHKDRFTLPYNSHYSWLLTIPANDSITFRYTDYLTAITTNRDVNIRLYGGSESGVTSSYTDVNENEIHYIEITLTNSNNVSVSVNVDLTIKHNCLMRKIDLKSEEINVPLYKKNEYTLYEKEGYSIVDWSLYYKNSSNQENSPVDCFLLPSESMPILVQTNTGEITSSQVPNGKYLVFASTYPSGVLTFKYGNASMTLSEMNTAGDTGWYLLALYNDNGTLKVYSGYVRHNNYIGYDERWTNVYDGSVKVENAPEKVYAWQTDSLPNAQDWFDNAEYQPVYATTEISMGSMTNEFMYGRTAIDKTLETNIKLINIPYSPTPFEIDENGKYVFDSCWTYNSGDHMLKLTDFNKRFENNVTTSIPSILNDFIQPVLSLDYIFNNDVPRGFFIDYDSKLFHSDYYRNKFVYDSFTKIFPLEQIDFLNSRHTDLKFSFDFVMSRNLVSKFLFKFSQIVYSNPMEDYPNILAVSRNNEEALYSSQYLDYIRTGYNYDLKAKERQERASGIGIGLNVAGLVASAVAGAVTGNPLAIGGAIGAGVGLVSQLVSYAKNTAQNEENIQRKLQETQMQSISVQNADDYDLLYAYTENKAKLCKYELSNEMKNILNDLFYYCGYVVNKQGYPDTWSRRTFNFVQASLEISKTNNLTNDIIQDIKNKFENGVTFLHYAFNRFNFEQDKENIEIILLPEEE